jgi:holo-[acyl-carrier protein] synthase
LAAARTARGRRLFASDELKRADSLKGERRAEFLAGRFAVKEAFAKAVGTVKGIEPRDIVCAAGQLGEPALRLGATARVAMGRAGCTCSSVSISHDAGMAVAVVVLY